METLEVKIQKTSTHPKGAEMKELLDSFSGTYLPVKLVAAFTTGRRKIEFYAEEEKRENGVGQLLRTQTEAWDLFQEIFDKNYEYKIYLTGYVNSGSRLIFDAVVEYEKNEVKEVFVDESVFSELCTKIIKNDICTEEDLKRNIRVMKEHRFSDDLIRQVLLRYKKYDRPARVPKTIYIDPDKESKTSILALGAVNVLIGAPFILEGDKSVGKNMYAETIAMIFNMPFDMTTMTRSMTADDLYGTKSTDNSASDLLTRDKAEEYLKAQRGESDFDMHAASEFEYLKAKAASVAIVQEHSSFVHWLQHGGVYCLNEMNMAEPNFLASFLNQITDDSKFIDIPGYGRINVNEDCVLIGTQNADYTGTVEQNEATTSRFACIAFDYPESVQSIIEAAVGKDCLSAEYFKQVDNFYKLLRTSVLKGTLTNGCLNIRGFIRALKAVAMVPGVSTLKKQIQLQVINTCPSDERNILLQNLNMRVTL